MTKEDDGLFKQHSRVGTFAVPVQAYLGGDTVEILYNLGFIPFHIKHFYVKGYFFLTGYSPKFRELNAREEVPNYEIQVDKDSLNRVVSVTVTEEIRSVIITPTQKIKRRVRENKLKLL